VDDSSEKGKRFQTTIGSKKVTTLPIPVYSDSVRLEFPIAVIEGKVVNDNSGRSIYIGGGNHGDEVNGIEVCLRLIDILDSSVISGRIFICPVQNPLGFISKQRLNPVDRLEMDQIYPGNPVGTITEKIANAIFETTTSKCDYVVDIHTATTGGRNIPHVYALSHESGVTMRSGLLSSLELARAFQPELVIETRRGVDYGFDLSHLTPSVAIKSGGSGVYVEIGEGNRIEESYIDRGVRGMLNILIATGFLSGTIENLSANTQYSSQVTYLKSPGSGLLHFKKGLGSFVKSGDLVAEIVEPLGSTISCFSPVDGLIFRVQTTSIASGGDKIAIIAHVE
jgi:uncharacterized protein